MDEGLGSIECTQQENSTCNEAEKNCQVVGDEQVRSGKRHERKRLEHCEKERLACGTSVRHKISGF